MGAHTEHGGSAAPRWANCPGSVQKVRGIPNRSGEYAKEGRLAHAAAEDCLNRGLDAQQIVDAGYVYNLADEGEPEDYRQLPAEFAAHVQEYVDHCRDLPGEHFVEQTYSFEPWVPGNQGTADHTAIHDGTLVVTDLKFGQGVEVSAVENEQLALYGIGAIEEHSLLHDIETVVLRICQPRRGHFSEWEVTAKELMETWAWHFREQYELSLTEDAPLVPGEKQCKFCLYAAQCPALYQLTLDTVAAEFDDVDELSDAGPRKPITVAEANDLSLPGLGQVLDNASLIETFLNRCRARAMEADEAGETVPGWKRVPGKSNRAWKDEEETVRVLRSMKLKVADIFNQKLRSPAQIEKEVTKRQRKRLDALIVKPEGKPSLVPDSDPREALRPAAEDFADMADSEIDDDLGL